MTRDERINTITVLELELEVLESKVKPHATGHILTAMNVINSRINELKQEDMKEEIDGRTSTPAGSCDNRYYKKANWSSC
jgi:hypothetical protein